MEELPLLSIIIPSFNMERYLPACCDSLLIHEEWLRRLEVLIINDGSTDHTSDIAHRYEKRHPGVFRVIDKVNGHYGSCVNRGLSEARGTYVKILDADDTFDTANLPLLLETLEASTADKERAVDLVVMDMALVNPDGKELEVVHCSVKPLAVLPISALVPARFKTQMHLVAYRTQMLREIKYRQTEGICYTDVEWAVLPMRMVERFLYFPHTIYRYQVGREGQSVDVEVFRKNFWMLGKVARNVIGCYEREKDRCVAAAKPYFKMRIGKFLQEYYDFPFLHMPMEEGNRHLGEFDDEFAKTSPELYEMLGEKTFPDRFGFRYISHWRRARHSSWRRSLFFNVFSRGARWLFQLKNHSR